MLYVRFVFLFLIAAVGVMNLAASGAKESEPLSQAVPESAKGPPVQLDPALQVQFRTLLSLIDQLIVPDKSQNAVSTTYRTVREQMLAGKLLFVVDSKSTNTNLLQSSYFSPNSSGTSWIVADPLLLNASKDRPDLALSLLVNALVFADGFFSDRKGFENIYQDQVESFLYSMDALYVQALFIRDYLKPHYPKLSPYCQFLTDTLDYENMAGAAMFVLGVDQGVVYGIRRLDASIRDKSLNASAYLAKISTMLHEIESKLDKAWELGGASSAQLTPDDINLRDRSRYVAVISSLTMLKYGVAIMNTQMGLFDPATRQKTAADLATFNKRLDALSARVEPLMSGVMGYRQKLLSSLGI